jgi:hypothetical protein
LATVGPMEDRPTASELLEAVGWLLDEEVLPVLEGGLQHKVRVAANLCRIVERELRLGPDADRRERLALGEIVGADGTLLELNDRFTTMVRTADADFVAMATPVLIAAVLDKLAVDKPGYALPGDVGPAGAAS